ncbi:class I SAM-dependent methyltransferase [Neobacillus notoginsengisoli]|uniref:Class I SAM-dependent methyltransferase n=1 Tax=Neobacillus notoginsengisoli TaxID=1578198 RepID=A0A417YUT2_9BACI|nr:class I SAM-dependent methyltransferase [Neobacillus notoginsengisoli]RHW40982.1 class I SAM-dependent methyltransferase [Neobacillus notoginsengisoli]
MSYGHFAYLYDQLMEDAPYDDWAGFALKNWQKHGPKSEKSFLDLGCGTGEISLRLADSGFHVTGVDLSPDMLAVAREKADNTGSSIRFVEQDMSELEMDDKYGIIGIFCDSLNYLESEEQVRKTFGKAVKYLVPGGLLMFDVHSIEKVANGFINRSFSLNGENVAYIWDSFSGEDPNSVEHEISFFVRDEQDGKYDRYDEIHYQRTFPVETYRSWLEEVGLEVVSITSDFLTIEPAEESERVFFVAKKSK